MLNQLGKECQKYVIITLTFFLELLRQILVLEVHPSEIELRSTGRKVLT